VPYLFRICSVCFRNCFICVPLLFRMLVRICSVDFPYIWRMCSVFASYFMYLTCFLYVVLYFFRICFACLIILCFPLRRGEIRLVKRGATSSRRSTPAAGARTRMSVPLRTCAGVRAGMGVGAVTHARACPRVGQGRSLAGERAREVGASACVLDQIWTTIGPCLDHGLIMFGLYSGHVWAMVGPRLGHVLLIFVPCLDHVWIMFGLFVGHLWTMVGPCLGNVSAMLGFVFESRVDLHAMVYWPVLAIIGTGL
jgi:hypothetical protein